MIAQYGFLPDRRKPGVLGTGVYFDLGSAESGFQPARDRYPQGDLVVFQVRIWAGNILDLDSPEVRKRFSQFQRELNRRLGLLQSREMSAGAYVDHFIERVLPVGESYHTVRRTFVNDGITRICVREPRRIEIVGLTDQEGNSIAWPPTDS
jgi:hypothetical protein